MQKASSSVSWVIDNFIYPKVCIICREWNKNELCSDCAKMVEMASGPCTNTGGLFDFGDICYFGKYSGKLKELVVGYKFHGEIWRGKAFGRLLFSMYKDYLKSAEFYCITYVPTGRTSLGKRGFDQCYEIASEISKQSGIRLAKLLEPNDILSQKNKQSSLDRIDRKINSTGRFVLSQNIMESIKGKRVLLIDDIITTGSTLRECAGLLADFGVKRIDCMVFATGRNDISSD